jgi:hypothetical protein
MASTRRALALLLAALLSLTAAACSAEGEISDEGIDAQIEGEDGGDGGDGG